MTRAQLEHAIRAACDVAGDTEVVIVGSQAVLGPHPDAPVELLFSREVDLYPRNRPERSDEVDGALGEMSLFDETHGFYIHGVGPETAVLPAGWEGRLVPVRAASTRGCTGWCLDVHDLAVSKLVAGREKDLDFVSALIRHGLAEPDVVRERTGQLPISLDVRNQVSARVARAEVAARPTR